MPLVTLTPFYKPIIAAVTYSEYVSALSPIAYWRLGETVPLSIDDDFTGTDGQPPNPFLWTQGTNHTIQSNTLQVNIQNAIENNATTSKFALTGDFDIQVDYDIQSYTETLLWRDKLRVQSISSSDFLEIERNYDSHVNAGGHELGFHMIKAGGSSTQYFTTVDNLTSKFRLTRVGTTVSGFIWTGSWTQVGTSYTWHTEDVVIELRAVTNTNIQTFVSAYDNFLVNSGAIQASTVAVDEIGTYHGTYEGVPLPTQDENGLITNDANTAVGFNHTLGQQVNCGESVSDAGIRTIVLSFNPTATYDSSATTYQAIFLRWDDDGDGTSNEDNYGLYLDLNTGRLVFIRYVGVDFSGTITSDQVSWTAGQTYHIIAVIDPVNGMMMYVDGIKQQLTHTSTLPVQTITLSNTTIGHWGDYVGDNRTFDGTIDDVALFTTALSENEAEDLYRLSKGWTLNPSTYQDYVLYDIPVAYWRLGEASGVVAVDEVNTAVGAYVNTPTLGSPSLLINNTDTATTFTAANSEWMESPNQSNFNRSIISIAVIIKVSSYPVSPANIVGYASYSNVTGTYDKILSLQADGTLDFYTFDGATRHNITNGVIPLDTIAHIVVTVSDTTSSIYINGTLDSAIASNGSYSGYTDAAIFIARAIGNFDAATTFIDGTMDEVAIFNHALTQNEVTDLYRSSIGFDPNVSNYKNEMLSLTPVAYWRLGETEGTLAADELQNNDGTYVNAPTLGATSLVTNDGNPATTFSNAANSYVAVTYTGNAVNTTSPFSVTFLVNKSSNVTSGTMISLPSDGENFLIFDGTSSGALYIDMTFGSSITWAGGMRANFGGFDTGVTYHIVATFDGVDVASISSFKFYVNGISQTIEVAGGLTSQTSSTLHISKLANLDGYSMNGTIDEVALFDKVLTPTEITSLYQKSIGN